MKTIVIVPVSILIAALVCAPAAAWSHANRYGGSTSHSYGSGSTTRTTAYGGSETHTYGQGTTATDRYGGSATHTYGQGTTATNRYGDTATHAYGSGSTTYTNAYGGSVTRYAYGTVAYGGSAYYPPGQHPPYYGGSYPAYHPPTTVNVYGSSCGNCGGWSAAGAAAAGAAVASANTSAAASTAYAAGYAAGSDAAPAYAMGAIYATLPAGCNSSATVGGTLYYLCGDTWFKPSYGANGVYYRVVPAP